MDKVDSKCSNEIQTEDYFKHNCVFPMVMMLKYHRIILKIITTIIIFLSIYNISVVGELTSFATPDNNPTGLTWDGRFFWIVHCNYISYSNCKAEFYTMNTDGFTEKRFTLDAKPKGLTWDGNYLWVCLKNYSENKIYKIDPSNGNIITSIESPGGNPIGLAWDGTHLWVADDNKKKIFRINPNNVKSQYQVNYPTGNVNMHDIAWDGTHLWITNDYYRGKICKIHPSSNDILETIKVSDDNPTGLTWDGNQLWVANDQRRNEIIFNVPPPLISIITSNTIDEENISISYKETSDSINIIDRESIKVVELSDGTKILEGSILSENGIHSVFYENEYIGAENWSISLDKIINNNFELTINDDDGNIVIANMTINNYNNIEKESWWSKNLISFLVLLLGILGFLAKYRKEIYNFFDERF